MHDALDFCRHARGLQSESSRLVGKFDLNQRKFTDSGRVNEELVTQILLLDDVNHHSLGDGAAADVAQANHQNSLLLGHLSQFYFQFLIRKRGFAKLLFTACGITIKEGIKKYFELKSTVISCLKPVEKNTLLVLRKKSFKFLIFNFFG